MKEFALFLPVAQYRGKDTLKRKIAPSEIEGSVSFPPSTKVDEDSLVRNVFVSALLRGKARTVKENRGEKTKEHFDNEVLLEQKLFSSTQFHPTFNNLPVLKPIPKNHSLQFIYILLSKHFYLNSLLPIISIYSSVPFLSKRTTLLSISSEIQAKEAEKHTNRREKSRKKATSIPTRTLY